MAGRYGWAWDRGGRWGDDVGWSRVYLGNVEWRLFLLPAWRFLLVLFGERLGPVEIVVVGVPWYDWAPWVARAV